MVQYFWLKVRFGTKVASLQELHLKFMLGIFAFCSARPQPLHFVPLILSYGMHFVKGQTWDRHIMAYKRWARVHRLNSNRDL